MKLNLHVVKVPGPVLLPVASKHLKYEKKNSQKNSTKKIKIKYNRIT